MVLAEWVRLCTVSFAAEGFVRLLVLAGSLMLMLEVKSKACACPRSWPCIARFATLGETGTVVLISRKRYEGNLDAVCSLRASGGTSIAHRGGLTLLEYGETKQAGDSRGFDRSEDWNAVQYRWPILLLLFSGPKRRTPMHGFNTDHT
jgi:hypothetical protein